MHKIAPKSKEKKMSQLSQKEIVALWLAGVAIAILGGLYLTPYLQQILMK